MGSLDPSRSFSTSTSCLISLGRGVPKRQFGRQGDTFFPHLGFSFVPRTGQTLWKGLCKGLLYPHFYSGCAVMWPNAQPDGKEAHGCSDLSDSAGQPHGACWKTTERWRQVGTSALSPPFALDSFRFGVNCFFNVDTKRLAPP